MPMKYDVKSTHAGRLLNQTKSTNTAMAVVTIPNAIKHSKVITMMPGMVSSHQFVVEST